MTNYLKSALSFILLLCTSKLTTAKNEDVSFIEKLDDMAKTIGSITLKLVEQDIIIASLNKKSIEQENIIDFLNGRINKLEKKETVNNGHKDFEIENEKQIVNSNEQTIEDRVSHLEELSKIKVLRTCDELHQHGVNISGMYFIDPDGEQIGHPPIRAFCDFEKQVTEIIHDTDNQSITIAHCDTELCFIKDILYQSPMDQIVALIQLSSSCSQEIDFSCFLAPLLYNDVEIATWTDRHGEDQVYFNGENYGSHLCSCYSDFSCSGQPIFNTTCNCDNSGHPEWLEDSGVITNMTALPISAFNYGPMEYDTQEAMVRIGRLRCSGRTEINPSPSTCDDLRKMGETKSGLYSLEDGNNDGYPKLSHCNMDSAGYDGNTETVKGWAKFSSGPGQTVFSVQHHGHDDIPAGSVITFETATINVGSSMDLDTGVFAATYSGVYQFSVSFLHCHAGSVRIHVFINENRYLQIYNDNVNDGDLCTQVSRIWMVQMEEGNTLHLVLVEGSFYGYEYFTEFIGKLI